MKDHVSASLEETAQIAGSWLKSVASDSAVLLVGLSGHLGAGKTAFVKAVAKELGIKEEITSPTFVIMKIYPFEKAGIPWRRLVHIDAYRLEKREELEVLDFENVVSDKNNLVMIEWPENVSLKPEDLDAYLKFEISGGNHHITEKTADRG